jgi:hypothetical protein
VAISVVISVAPARVDAVAMILLLHCSALAATNVKPPPRRASPG